MCKRIERTQLGLTLIELIVFIVIVSVGMAGILVTYDTVVRHSADPLARKQALAIAESLLLEVEQQPFTWCDPQDENVATATSGNVGVGGCATMSQDGLLGPTPASELRGNNANPFDNVADYANFAGPASDILGVNAINGYNVQVVIAQAGGIGAFAGFPADAVLRIAVTVVGRGETVTLVGFRTRYAPNAAG